MCIRDRYNAATALVYKAIPMVPIEQVARHITILSSLIVIGSLYYLLRMEVSRLSAVFASLIYAIFPFFVYYSRVILPETPGLACMSISIVMLYLYMKSESRSLKWVQFVLAGIAACLLYTSSHLLELNAFSLKRILALEKEIMKQCNKQRENIFFFSTQIQRHWMMQFLNF